MQVVYVACVVTLLFCSCSAYPRDYIRHKAAVAGARAGDEFFEDNNVRASEVDSNNNVVHRQQQTDRGLARISQFSTLRLVGGEHSCEGRLEFIDSSGQPRQVCHLNFGDEEARVVCGDLGCSSQGARSVDPRQFGFSPAINFYFALGLECTGTESTILNCQFNQAVCVTDSAAHAIAVICGGTPGEAFRLVGGSSPCEGRLVTLRDGEYGQACDLRTGDNEAKVICRQLGCAANRAERVPPELFGFSRGIGLFHTFGADCVGDENQLSECSQRGGICFGSDPQTAVAIDCEPPLTGIQKLAHQMKG